MLLIQIKHTNNSEQYIYSDTAVRCCCGDIENICNTPIVNNFNIKRSPDKTKPRANTKPSRVCDVAKRRTERKTLYPPRPLPFALFVLLLSLCPAAFLLLIAACCFRFHRQPAVGRYCFNTSLAKKKYLFFQICFNLFNPFA